MDNEQFLLYLNKKKHQLNFAPYFSNHIDDQKKNLSPPGFETVTFELEVQRANPLRHGDYVPPWN